MNRNRKKICLMKTNVKTNFLLLTGLDYNAMIMMMMTSHIPCTIAMIKQVFTNCN